MEFFVDLMEDLPIMDAFSSSINELFSEAINVSKAIPLHHINMIIFKPPGVLVRSFFQCHENKGELNPLANIINKKPDNLIHYPLKFHFFN